jgi:hypothetical protein
MHQVLIEVKLDMFIVIMTRIHNPLVVANLLALVVRMIDTCSSLESLALIQSVLGVLLASHCRSLIENHVNLGHLEDGDIWCVPPVAIVFTLF